MTPSTQVEKSGVHLTGVDSGWPTGAAIEPGYEKPGDGTDANPKATAVAAGVISDNGTDEIQTLTINGAPAGGDFTVKIGAGGSPSSAIPFSPTAAQVRTALEASADIGVGDVTVVGSTGGPFTITFVGALADKNVAALQLGTNSLTGGTTPAPAFATSTPGAPR